ncbi:MAG: dTDP-4-dehydrorhamnose reductase [Bacteroidota bacterium]
MIYSRVLITGANGLVGQALVKLLSTMPVYDVLATGRSSQPRFVGGSCGYVPLDVTREEAVKQVFMDFAPDVVVHCAAMTKVDRCEQHRDACWQVNVEAVERLARWCHRTGSRLIQLSTDFVFDGTNGPYREDARPNPVNFYGKSKLAAENATRAAGLDRWSIVRPVLIFGTGSQLSRSNFVLWVVRELTQGRTIQVVTDQFRTPTYAPDLALGIEKIIRYRKHGLYHLSGRDLVSVHAFAHLIAEAFDLDPSLIQPTDASAFSQPAARPARTGFIILKAESELGYKPRSLQAALRHLGTQLGLPTTAS